MLMMEKVSLYAMQGTLSVKKDHLVQLKSCKTELKSIKEEFIDSKDTMKNPKLSANTWQGILADSFTETRNEIKKAYHEIEFNQFNNLLDKLNEHITSIQGEIDTLGKEISSLKGKIERLEKEEKESH
ncbi:YwqH-like family protein [Bacillus vallismortis]|uniref:YwqH-like family protein n=1 Tax=Bacillus vallismortis TaxID=72361 RepID=UPI002091849C|nr:DUF5082 family protein [Bacillus vallismortis]MCO4852398.1 DUF5082 family protein [Bacillus vallismortis]